MQITDTVKNCNGCEACVVGCKYNYVKMKESENGARVPVIDENGCSKCNACKLFCPLFNPVELPIFEDWYEYKDEYRSKKMASIYRETMRSVRSGQHTEFVGTLCQIAALKSLMGDKLRPNLIIFPLLCTDETRKGEGCKACVFY